MEDNKYKLNLKTEEKKDYYIIASKDIKRITLPSDDSIYGEDIDFASQKVIIKSPNNGSFTEVVNMPKYVLCKLKPGGFLEELSSGAIIVSEKYKNDKFKCIGLYFTVEDKYTGKKVEDYSDIEMCYNNSRDPLYLKQVKQTLYNFFNKGVEAMQIKVAEEYKTIRKYN
jgi:hypothetical protein